MKIKIRNITMVGAGLIMALNVSTNAEEIRPHFDDNTLDEESHFGGAGSGETGFTSGDWDFPQTNDESSWSGFSYSNETDTTTAGYTNQFSAITGGGVNGSDNYGICYVPLDWGSGTYEPIPQVTSATGEAYDATFEGLYVTNTTYAYHSMLNGDSSAKKFGGDSGDDPDWFKLTIKGLDTAGQYTGTEEFFLADFRFEDNSNDYIVDEWTWIDLSELGDIAALEFSLSSSDTGDYGMNTPGYFAMDAVPEPTTLVLLSLAGLTLLQRRRFSK